MAILLIACPHCGRVRLWPEGPKTTKCPNCGRGFSSSTAHVWGRFATQEDAREALGRVNAQIAGEPGAVEKYAQLRQDIDATPTDALGRAVAKARGVAGQPAKAEAVARGLTAEFGTWDEAQYIEAMDRISIGADRARAHLDRLLGDAVVAEPRLGTYRTT